LSADGARLFAGGAVTAAAGVPRNRAAAVSTASGGADVWDPSTDAPVHAVAASGAGVFVGGEFTSGNGDDRLNLAALDAATGELDRSVDLPADREVRAFAVSADGARLFVGGRFNRIGGLSRPKLASVDLATGTIESFRPRPSSVVFSLAVHANRVYMGMSGGRVGGVQVGRLDDVDATTGAVDTTFTPNPDRKVNAIAITPDGATILAGGAFAHIGGQDRTRLATVDALTGVVLPFNPSNVNGGVLTVALTPDGTVAFAGTTGNRTTAYAHASSNSPLWSQRTNGDIQALAATNTTVYIGGHFTSFGSPNSARRSRLASMDIASGTLTSWDPRPNSPLGVWSISVTPDALLAGGDFTTVARIPQPHFARFSGAP